MEHLWSPWRYRYVSKAGPTDGCVFCNKLARNDDEKDLIVFRGVHNFVVLNLYPYTSGHLMVVPYAHLSLLRGTAHGGGGGDDGLDPGSRAAPARDL